MSESLFLPDNASKSDLHAALLPQLQALVESETDLIANLANVAAVLREAFGWWWVGFYLVNGEQLVLGPFQGPLACTRIAYGRGVCGKAWQEAKSFLVPDVNQFPGHIACSSLSVSEIVVPVFNSSEAIVAVLDVDSEQYDVLDETDVRFLEALSRILSPIF